MVKCVSCGYSKEISINNHEEYEEEGFNTLWDIANGLTHIILCSECAERVKDLVGQIEDITEHSIEDINFTGF